MLIKVDLGVSIELGRFLAEVATSYFWDSEADLNPRFVSDERIDQPTATMESGQYLLIWTFEKRYCVYLVNQMSCVQIFWTILKLN